MPIDLDSVPAKLAHPDIPHLRMWGLVGVPGSLVIGGVIMSLWPQTQWFDSLWFWACAVIFPFLTTLCLFSLILYLFEKRRNFVISWNQQHDETMQALVRQGQQPIAVLATSFITAAGAEQLAKAILEANKTLKPELLESNSSSIRVGQLNPPATDHDETEYCRRLQLHLNQVLLRIRPALVRAAAAGSVQVRIRHDGSLSDESMLLQWREATSFLEGLSEVLIVDRPQGLLWLDQWLDDADKDGLVLSVEINLFREPVEGQGESVSAVLLARSIWASRNRWAPRARVHRPVVITAEGKGMADALLWANVRSPVLPRTWYSQVNGTFMSQLTLAMKQRRPPFDLAICHDLDSSIGMSGVAVGNMALIVAVEQASEEARPQLVILGDATTQACVVRPV